MNATSCRFIWILSPSPHLQRVAGGNDEASRSILFSTTLPSPFHPTSTPIHSYICFIFSINPYHYPPSHDPPYFCALMRSLSINKKYYLALFYLAQWASRKEFHRSSNRLLLVIYLYCTCEGPLKGKLSLQSVSVLLLFYQILSCLQASVSQLTTMRFERLLPWNKCILTYTLLLFRSALNIHE